MTPHNTISAFDTLNDYELMLLQEMCGRNFDYCDESRELLDVFIRMEDTLVARGFSHNPKKVKTPRAHKAA